MTAEEAILSLLTTRDPGKTICPSEAARLLADPGEDWRQSMGTVHAAADRLAGKREVVLTWKGEPRRTPTDGPYRIGCFR